MLSEQGFRQHYGNLDLPLRDGPVNRQEPILLFRFDLPEPVLLVKPDRPGRGSPGANQDRSLDLLEQVVEQEAAQPSAPVRRGDVGVADQSHVPDRLDAHDADQDAIGFNTGESNTLGDLVLQLFAGQRVTRGQTC